MGRELLCEPENFTDKIIFMSMLHGMQKEMMNYVSIIQRQLKKRQKDLVAVTGLSVGLDPKRSGAELMMANLLDLGIERRRNCCRISKIPIIQYSDVPALWREDNEEAKEKENEERQGNVLQECEERFEKLSEDEKLSRLCSEAGLRLVEVDNSSLLFRHQQEKHNNFHAEKKHCVEIKRN